MVVAFVYKVVNDINDKIYIGSTKQTLSARLDRHFSDAEKHPNRKFFKEINEIGFNHFSIIELEQFTFTTKFEQFKREQVFINKCKPVLNTLKAYYGFDQKSRKQPRIWCEFCRFEGTKTAYEKHCKTKMHVNNVRH